MKTSGCNVLSDEYSYPISSTLVFWILPMLLDIATKLAPVPSSDITLSNSGNFL